MRDFIDPRVISRLQGLALDSRLPMVGSVSGRHRSPTRGSSLEFSEYRKYVPGDDTRRLDWRTYARTDRFYVKEFEADTNLRCYLVLDCSGSMGLSGRGADKLAFARSLAGTLADLVRNVHGRVAADAELASRPDASAYADAVTTYLALALSRTADWNSTLGRWEPNGHGPPADLWTPDDRDGMGLHRVQSFLGEHRFVRSLWGLGWDTSQRVEEAKRLNTVLGNTRLDFHEVKLSKSYPISEDIPERFRPLLNESVVFYLEGRSDPGFLSELKNLSWKALVFEGHAGEIGNNGSDILEKMQEDWNCRIAATSEIRDDKHRKKDKYGSFTRVGALNHPRIL